MSAWYDRVLQTDMEVIGRPEDCSLQSLYEESVLKRRVLCDPAHIPHSEHELSLSGRQDRGPLCKHNRFKNSFVPASIRILNM